MGCKIHSTCSNAMVIHYPKKDIQPGEDDDDMQDVAIPETYVTVIQDGKLVTTALEGLE